MALLLAVLASGETIVLRESAHAEGRYVRLLECVEAEWLGEETRRLLGSVYLGRAPEDGQVRALTVEEIQRELELRGIDPGRFEFVGRRVEVASAAGGPGTSRRAVVAEIRRAVLERHPGLRPEELEVRLVDPDAVLEMAVVREVRVESPAFGTVRYVAALEGPGAREVRGRAEVTRARHVQGRAARPAGGAADRPAVRAREIVRAAGSAFEVDARALQDGGVGQVILLEFLSTGNRFRGRVTEAGRVAVAEEDP
jgi:hypothetical protein